MRRQWQTNARVRWVSTLVIALATPLAALCGGAMAAAPAGAATASSLSVRPARGPVGSTVTISGVNCAGATGTVGLEFRGIPEAGTRGSVSLLDVHPAASGRFSVTFVVPATVGQMQGDTDGPTTPGRYQFTGHVPGCTAAFTVTTGTATAAGTTRGTGAARVAAQLPATGRSTVALALLGFGLLLLGAGSRLVGASERGR